MKLPAIQFYPADWRKDAGVQALSFHDRGVWFEILCLMHESERRGVLLLNGKSMPVEALARVIGVDIQTLTTTLTTIITYGVASVEPDTGALVCRRMVRDEQLMNSRREAGKKGGNPALLKKVVNQESTTPDKQKPTPSSSVSSSSSDILPPTAAGGASNLVVPPKHRRTDPLFLALAALEGSNVDELTEPGSGAIAAALRDIQAATPDVTLAEIAKRAERYRKLMTAPLTACGLAKNWARCAAPVAAAEVIPDEPDRWFERLEAIVDADSPFLDEVRNKTWPQLTSSQRDSILQVIAKADGRNRRRAA